MIRNSTFFLLLLLSFSAGSVHTITLDEHIRDDYFYTIPSILERIPELQVHAVNSTDQSISRLGQSSVNQNSVMLYVNSVKFSPLQDGRQVMDLRTIANGRIDTIEVYTGVHAVQWGGNSSVVVNIISSPITKNSIGGTAYTGSEIGDPAAMLRVLDEEEIPYNKEQLAAGELYGTVITQNVAHYGGVSMVYMDRYSNGGESLRSNQFGDLNSNNSMQEIRKAFYTVQYNRQFLNSAIDFALVDYNLFRYDQIMRNYNFYRGTAGHVTIREDYRRENFWLTAHVGGMYEDATLYESKNDSIMSEWGDLALFSEIGFTGDKGTSFALSVIGDSEFGETPHSLSDSSGYFDLSDPWQISTTVKLPNNRLVASVSYPPSITATTTVPINEKSSINGGVSMALKHDDDWDPAFYGAAEIDYDLKLGERGSFSVGTGFDQRPEVTQSGTGVYFGDTKFVPWGEMSIGYGKYVRGSVHGSAYGVNGTVQSEIVLNGLTLGTGISILTRTYWDSFGNQTTKREKSGPLSTEADYAHAISPRMVGNVKLTYALFDDHVKMAIAVRDIGKAYRETPYGSMIGPVVVSNFSFGF